MKRLFTLTFFFVMYQLANAQVIDETAATRYFELVKSLKAGNSLQPETWQSFLEMEGNKLYIENQNFNAAYLESYRKEMEIVYMPQHDSLLQVRLQNPQKHYLTFVIYQYKAGEAELLEYLAQLSGSKDDYIKAMYSYSYQMLPGKLQKKSPDTKLYFIALENDAIAQSGNIVFTLWAAYNYDKEKYGALAGHELHHVIRPVIQYQVEEKDKGLLMLLNKISNEGGPDLIDKRITMAPGFPDNLRFGEYFLMLGEKALPMIDAAVAEMAAGTKTYTTRDMNQFIGSSGHIPGFYMADIIERNGLKKKLIKNIQDPFQFIYLYNKAAKKDKAKPFVFSEQTIAYIKSVEAGAKKH